MKETTKTYCPYCKKRKAEWYTKIGYWSNIIVGHCLKCDKYFIDDYGSSIDVDSNCSIVNNYYSITKDQYNEFIKDGVKAKDIQEKCKYGSGGFKHLENKIEAVD